MSIKMAPVLKPGPYCCFLGSILQMQVAYDTLDKWRLLFYLRNNDRLVPVIASKSLKIPKLLGLRQAKKKNDVINDYFVRMNAAQIDRDTLRIYEKPHLTGFNLLDYPLTFPFLL